ncbi:MAG: alanine racemase, partial [Candidatus Rokuibacteriota bacterium]
MLVQDLDTPVVTIHLDAMEANIRRVQAQLDRHGVGNRPHIKTHKIPAIARRQLDGGAIGIVCQKIGEVEVFADHGVTPDVLLTYNVLGRQKLDRLMAVARRVDRLTVVLDNEVVARGLSEAGARSGQDVHFVVECDTGGARNGVQTPDAAFELAQAVMKLPRMDFQGLMTFPNRDPDTRLYFERALE